MCSDNATTMLALLAQLSISEPLFHEVVSYITEVMTEYQCHPDVVVVEVEAPEVDFERGGLDPAGLRALSDGRRIHIPNHQHTNMDDFILRHTTEDILAASKVFARQGNATLLLFVGKRYGMIPLRKFKGSESALVQ